MVPVTSLYVHVPFCRRKCGYCAFVSEPVQPERVTRYLAELERELELIAGDLRPQTVYFGGGTPTVLTLAQWERLLAAWRRLGLLEAGEWTVECNPATFTRETMRWLRDQGVNRVSLGVQCFEDQLLQRLGRPHNRAMALEAWAGLRQAGFDNLNLDLMFAIPGQTLAGWEATLAEALALGSEHLSCYEVTYEEDTPLFRQLAAGQVPVDQDLACDMYEALVARSADAGLELYEVSNFARNPGDGPGEFPSRACRHNLNYWRGGDYYGIGPAATSYVRGVRSRNYSDLDRYEACLQQGRRPIESSERLEPLARAGELAAFGLRLRAGWPFDLFQERTGFDLRREWANEIQQLIALEYGCLEGDRFRLTASGLRFADWVAEQFLRP